MIFLAAFENLRSVCLHQDCIVSHFCAMFRVAGYLLDHADVHVLGVAVAGALEVVPKQHRGHNRHYHKLDHNAHFDF